MDDHHLANKLYTPPPCQILVLPPRLIEALSKSQTSSLTLVSAPAGYGKTTLVSNWLRQTETPSTWLSLDEGDNDPIRFLQYFLKALQKIDPEIQSDLLGMPQELRSAPFEALLNIIINEIVERITPFIFVLDDFHIIHSESVLKALAYLLEHLPPQMHLVILTRHRGRDRRRQSLPVRPDRRSGRPAPGRRDTGVHPERRVPQARDQPGVPEHRQGAELPRRGVGAGLSGDRVEQGSGAEPREQGVRPVPGAAGDRRAGDLGGVLQGHVRVPHRGPEGAQVLRAGEQGAREQADRGRVPGSAPRVQGAVAVVRRVRGQEHRRRHGRDAAGVARGEGPADRAERRRRADGQSADRHPAREQAVRRAGDARGERGAHEDAGDHEHGVQRRDLQQDRRGAAVVGAGEGFHHHRQRLRVGGMEMRQLNQAPGYNTTVRPEFLGEIYLPFRPEGNDPNILNDIKLWHQYYTDNKDYRKYLSADEQTELAWLDYRTGFTDKNQFTSAVNQVRENFNLPQKVAFEDFEAHFSIGTKRKKYSDNPYQDLQEYGPAIGGYWNPENDPSETQQVLSNPFVQTAITALGSYLGGPWAPERKGIIVVTHDVADAVKVAQRFLYLRKGRILFDGGLSALRTTDDPDLREFIKDILR